MVDPAGWYYCVKHGKVEHGSGCRSLDRLGPYPDAETASNALAIAKARTEQADAQDQAWKDEDEDEDR
ncbi:hypothetical protein [Actinoalloteichus hymeniacidonis]|uniref:hypothetical protein n=1 Tax=Actinoalloteichus hymeniacidonis TaxID=340345 RepID=UPI00183F8B38|nr:hypothetical protein [Actinoalloteichus hymeniacidonis]MBB5906731.1 putative NBD/HSP70 family sugar kinase [Actinoalloteichus hymeniacidonis]